MRPGELDALQWADLDFPPDDGGTLVRELYGHPDAAIARERIRAAFRTSAPVVALPSSHGDARATG